MEIEGAARPGMVTKDGLMICGTDGEDDGAGDEDDDGDNEDGGSKANTTMSGDKVKLSISMKIRINNNTTSIYSIITMIRRQMALREATLGEWKVCEGARVWGREGGGA